MMAMKKAKEGPPVFGIAHLDNLTSNVVEVDHLLSHHPAMRTATRGRQHNVEVINKSCIVLLCACWEAFVEDLAAAALETLIELGGTHRVFPETVLASVASGQQGLKAWELAGDGWRDVMRSNFSAALKKTGAFNTPKTQNVDDMFRKTLGIEKISVAWKWRGMPAGRAASKLDEFVSLRGDIAHRVAGAHVVTLDEARGARELMFRLAVLTNNAVVGFLQSKLNGDEWMKGSGWTIVWYGETR